MRDRASNFFRRPRHGWRLKILLNNAEDGITISGDKAGLEYLASCCLAIIGRTGPSGHFHIEPLMYTASAGSLPMLLEFTDDKRIAYAATGRPINVARNTRAPGTGR